MTHIFVAIIALVLTFGVFALFVGWIKLCDYLVDEGISITAGFILMLGVPISVIVAVAVYLAQIHG